MRGAVPGLESAVPLAEQLPAAYQEDDFTVRFVSAFDTALAPVVSTLDNLAAYVDPHLAPDDFLEVLGGWVGVELSRSWDASTRRGTVVDAVADIRRTGTARCIADAVRLLTGGEVEIAESGATSWSRTPGALLPGEPTAWLRVTVRVAEPERVDVRAVERLLAAGKPAHVVHTLEVVGDQRGEGGDIP